MSDTIGTADESFDYQVLGPAPDKPPIELPVTAQLAVVNNMILPLLKRTGIDVNVEATRDGMTLRLAFKEPAAVDVDEAKTLGTEDPDNARLLWALRDKIESHRAHQST